MDDLVHNIDADRLRNFAAQALEQGGIRPEGAAIVADCLVEADLRGVDTHGVVRLDGYLRMMKEGNMNPRPRLSVIRETPVSAVIDADNAVGNLASHAAAEMAIGKAKSAGVGVVGVRNSTHNGALAYYPMMALKHDMISLMTTNAPPQTPAYGGTSLVLSTNPFAAAVPAGEELPVVLDMATTMVAVALRQTTLCGMRFRQDQAAFRAFCSASTSCCASLTSKRSLSLPAKAAEGSARHSFILWANSTADR